MYNGLSACMCVCLSVCLLVTSVSPEKTGAPILPFGMWIRGAQGAMYCVGAQSPKREGALL